MSGAAGDRRTARASDADRHRHHEVILPMVSEWVRGLVVASAAVCTLLGGCDLPASWTLNLYARLMNLWRVRSGERPVPSSWAMDLLASSSHYSWPTSCGVTVIAVATGHARVLDRLLLRAEAAMTHLA